MRRWPMILVMGMMFFQSMKGQAQWGASFTAWTVFDGNAFRNYEQLSDRVVQPEATLFYDLVSDPSRMRFWYEGSLVLFDEYQARQFHSHRAGLTARHDLGKIGSMLSWGLQGGRRFNRTEHSYYDYRNATGYLQLRIDGGRWGIWQAGIRGRYQEYTELPEFSFREADGFLKANFSLPTRTTLIGRFEAGIKDFVQGEISEELIQETVPLPGNGNGRGNGKGNAGGLDDGGGQTVTQVVLVESPRAAIFRWIGSVRLAQSLGSKTGLAVEGILQRVPEEGGRVLSGQDSGYETDDDLFDDPYSYESETLLVELTRMLPLGFEFKAGHELHEKHYHRIANDLNGEAVDGSRREDSQSRFWASLRKPFPARGLFQSIQLSLNYSYIRNDSNDAYFHYDGHSGSVGFQFSL